jgi:hypothetical protein
MRAIGCVLVLAAITACVPAPPAAPAPHTAMEVSASFGRTWDALIDEFSQRNIPIKTIERASGLIATDGLRVDASSGLGTGQADCGKDWAGVPAIPTEATYNALVRGDSSHATIRVTVRWVRLGKSRVLGNSDNVSEECSTKGVWETALEKQIKERAETKAASR